MKKKKNKNIKVFCNFVLLFCFNNVIFNGFAGYEFDMFRKMLYYDLGLVRIIICIFFRNLKIFKKMSKTVIL